MRLHRAPRHDTRLTGTQIHRNKRRSVLRRRVPRQEVQRLSALSRIVQRHEAGANTPRSQIAWRGASRGSAGWPATGFCGLRVIRCWPTKSLGRLQAKLGDNPSSASQCEHFSHAPHYGHSRGKISYVSQSAAWSCIGSQPSQRSGDPTRPLPC